MLYDYGFDNILIWSRVGLSMNLSLAAHPNSFDSQGWEFEAWYKVVLKINLVNMNSLMTSTYKTKLL